MTKIICEKMTIFVQNRGMLPKSDIFKTSGPWMFLPISVAEEPEDPCGTNRLALYLSGVQPHELDCIPFCKNRCFLGLAALYGSKFFRTL